MELPALPNRTLGGVSAKRLGIPRRSCLPSSAPLLLDYSNQTHASGALARKCAFFGGGAADNTGFTVWVSRPTGVHRFVLSGEVALDV